LRKTYKQAEKMVALTSYLLVLAIVCVAAYFKFLFRRRYESVYFFFCNKFNL